jgi:phage portal protein BeeE
MANTPPRPPAARSSEASRVRLEEGLKWRPLDLSMVDSKFIESRNFYLRDVARAFDVPPYKLAIEGETDGPSKASGSPEI